MLLRWLVAEARAAADGLLNRYPNHPRAADIRTQLEGAIKDSTVYANAIASTENGRALEGIKAIVATAIQRLDAHQTPDSKAVILRFLKEWNPRATTEDCPLPLLPATNQKATFKIKNFD